MTRICTDVAENGRNFGAARGRAVTGRAVVAYTAAGLPAEPPSAFRSAIMDELFSGICDHIERATGRPFRPEAHRPVGGGCINRSAVIEGRGVRYFVKVNGSAVLPTFEAEAEGLGALRKASPLLRVPAPVCSGVWRGRSYLVLEYLELAPSADPSVQAALGRGLARLHRASAERFGWHRDNAIGSTPQANSWRERWQDFYAEMRLLPQLEMAYERGIGRQALAAGERLAAALPALFSDYRPRPSLLHGDLWGGNVAADPAGAPVVFDPAPYFGDREADLAMTELFGGFGRAFYAAYDDSWPRDSGYGARRALYNLYHVLNHFNMFGGGYATQAHGMIRELLARLG